MTERSDDTQPLAEARTAVHEVINDETERITAVAATESRRWFSRSVLAAGLVALIVTTCFSVAALIVAGRADNRVDQQDVKLATLREIADGLGLTEARISQILSKTLRTLRGQFEDAPVEARLAA